MQSIFKSSMPEPLEVLKSWGGIPQDLHKIFSQRPVQDHALQGPLRGFHQDLCKIFSQGIARDLGRYLHLLKIYDCTMKFLQGRHRRTLERTQKISLPQDLRQTAKSSTAQQQEWSDTHIVPRRLCEWYQKSHCATTRVIWHAQNQEKVTGFSHFFVEVVWSRAILHCIIARKFFCEMSTHKVWVAVCLRLIFCGRRRSILI